MKIPNRLLGGSLALGSILVLGGCSGGKAGDRNNRGPFKVTEITTGLNQIFPYRIRKVDSFGNPTSDILNITDTQILKDNVNGNNGVLPVGIFSDDSPPKLPNGADGNQFFLFLFSHHLKVQSILSDKLADVTNSGLTTSISMLEYNTVTEDTTTLKGRGFVGGYTYVNDGFGNLILTQAVRNNGGVVQILHPIANGFPRGFTNDTRLVEPNAFVFVADADSNLSTLDAFPDAGTDNRLLRMRVSNAVEDTGGGVLEEEVCSATTVGSDSNPPDVLGFSGLKPLSVSPGNGDKNVDPLTEVEVRFNKPVQPGDVGVFFTKSNLTPATGGVTLSITIAAQTFSVIYYADPLTAGDLCNYKVTPAYNLPGLATVNVAVNNTTVRGLDNVFLGNTVNTTFDTGSGPGIVNSPVGADALYVGMGGGKPGIKVIDLNGFGQGTGGFVVDPTGIVAPKFDITTSNFPNNPNVGSTGIFPNLAPGTSSLDAGSSGAFTLVQDTVGDTLLVGSSILGQVADIQIGCPLDMVFNNFNINVNATTANHTDLSGAAGRGNGFASVPHPNPPKLLFPPPNVSQSIFGEEPTADPRTGPCGVTQPINLLVSGNPFTTNPGQRGLFGHAADVFNGPAPAPASPPPPTPSCPYSYRQQIGHFLYVLDAINKQVVVLNSNRMTVLDTIKLQDPVDMAMSPNLRRLAVSNFSSSTISFIDIDPTSQKFHTIVDRTKVDAGPSEIAWQPDGEDILVVHPRSNQLTILNGLDLQLRKRVSGFINSPVAIAVTGRYAGGGLGGNPTGLYYAYILNKNGALAVFESGPDGTNGIGFDDITGTVPNVTFRTPRAMRLDYNSLNAGILVSHSDDRGNGVVSKLEITSSPGVQPVQQNQGGFILPPTFRQKEWKVVQTYGGISQSNTTRDLLSGRAPGDLAQDEMFNNASTAGQLIAGLQRPPLLHSDKSLLRPVPGGYIPANAAPKFLFVAIVDKGVVDVFDYGTASKLAVINVGGTPSVLGTYFRQ